MIGGALGGLLNPLLVLMYVNGLILGPQKNRVQALEALPLLLAEGAVLSLPLAILIAARLRASLRDADLYAHSSALLTLVSPALQSIEASESLRAFPGELIVSPPRQRQSPGGIPQQRLGLVDPAQLQLQDTELGPDFEKSHLMAARHVTDLNPWLHLVGGTSSPACPPSALLGIPHPIVFEVAHSDVIQPCE